MGIKEILKSRLHKLGTHFYNPCYLSYPTSDTKSYRMIYICDYPGCFELTEISDTYDPFDPPLVRDSAVKKWKNLISKLESDKPS